MHWILYKVKHFFVFYMGILSHDHQNRQISSFFEILAIFKVSYWVRPTFSHDMTLYAVLFNLCSKKIKKNLSCCSWVPYYLTKVSPKWVRIRWWLQVLKSKLPQTIISYIIFSQILYRFQVLKSKYNQKISLGSDYVNNRIFWLRVDLIFLIMK